MNNYTVDIRPDEVIAYFRKSRTDDPTLSVEEVLAKHEAMLDEWAIRNLGTTIPEENKYREVVSGETIAARPEVQKVLKLIESPKIKAILIVEIARLSRGDLEDAGRLIKLIRYTNTLVITPMKTFDLKDEYDRDMFERELKRSNEYLEYQKKLMNRGRLLSVSQGNYISPTPVYGYDKVFIQEGKRKCPVLAINEEQANVVRMIFDMYVNQNMGYHAISKKLDELKIAPPRGKYWAGCYITEMLSNIHYLGKVRWNYRKTVVVVDDGEVKKTTPKANEGEYLVFDGKHPAIISDALFKAAQEKKGSLPRVKIDFTIQNPLAGIIRCSKCGHAVVHRKFTKCASRLMCRHQNHCGTGSVIESEVIDMVARILKQKIVDFRTEMAIDNSDSISLHEKMIKNLEKKLESLKAREISQWEAQSDPDPSKRMPQHIFQTLNAKLLKEKEEVEKALDNAYSNMPAKIDYEQKIITLQNALDCLSDNTKSALEKNLLLKTCIKKIELYREKTVHLKGKGNFHKYTVTPIELKVELKV